MGLKSYFERRQLRAIGNVLAEAPFTVDTGALFAHTKHAGEGHAADSCETCHDLRVRYENRRIHIGQVGPRHRYSKCAVCADFDQQLMDQYNIPDAPNYVPDQSV